MRILLITLPSEGEPRDFTTPGHYAVGKLKYIPLGLLAVASGIHSKHEIRILDAASHFLTIDQTLAAISDWDPDVLGMTSSIGTCHALLRILREAKTPLKVVGGPHTTHFADEVLAQGAHAVFVHDGDRSFNQWLNNGCPTGVFKDYIANLDMLPMPALQHLNLSDYHLTDAESKVVLLKNKGLRFPMYSSKGCPFHCTFCDVQERRFRYKSPQRVVDEMVLYLEHGADSIHLMDDCFNVKASRVREICEVIHRRGLKFEWSARGRAKMDFETAKALRHAGCVRLHVGVETLDPAMMKNINKKTTIENMREFFATCREVGIQTLGYFIIGFEGETREYRRRLPEMIRELGVDIPFFNILYPLPNTPIYDEFVQRGIYTHDFWRQYVANPVPGFEPPPYTSKEDLAELLETAERYVREFFPDSPNAASQPLVSKTGEAGE